MYVCMYVYIYTEREIGFRFRVQGLGCTGTSGSKYIRFRHMDP